MAKQTKGFCKYCGKEYTKSGMLRHLDTCKSRKAVLESEDKKDKGYFELVLSGKYGKAYWLIVEISETATLKDLDEFIRDIWVECCGHLSAFEINREEYESTPDMGGFWGAPAKGMNYKLKKVISVGDVMKYEYDFGSTTELVIEVRGYRKGKKMEDVVTILSRNNPPELLCCQCEINEAKWINVEAYFDGDLFWCEECAKRISMRKDIDMEEDEVEEWEEFYEDYLEGMMPICNSPRMGVCGYDGSRYYPEQFLPDGVTKIEKEGSKK